MGEVIAEDVLWACTTCGACHQECPVCIEPIPKIVNMRRFLVMEEARFPEPMQAALRSLENRGHPYQGVVPSRTAWAKGLAVPLLAEKGAAEYLYWVGCAGAFDERAQQVARAFVQVLRAAGVDFAILGEEERCTGDPARRMGHEFLFQLQAQGNIETFTRYGVRKILTTCPHCFNTLGNEYSQFGGHYEVRHHTVFLQELLRQGRLRPTRPLDKRVAYHDACYLGRHNGIFEAPRTVLASLPGVAVKEFERTRENGLLLWGGRRPDVDRRADRHARQYRAHRGGAARGARHRRDGLPVLLEHVRGRHPGQGRHGAAAGPGPGGAGGEGAVTE